MLFWLTKLFLEYFQNIVLDLQSKFLNIQHFLPFSFNLQYLHKFPQLSVPRDEVRANCLYAIKVWRERVGVGLSKFGFLWGRGRFEFCTSTRNALKQSQTAFQTIQKQN